MRIQPPPEIAATVEQVRATVAENPDAIGDLMLLRDFEAGTRNFAEAARLSERILDALGADAALSDLLVQIELMVLATNGVVSDEAAAVLGRAVAMSPDHPGVLFYRGLLMSNIGRPDLAFALWRPLAEATDAPTPYSDRARQLIGDVAWAAGVDYALPALPGPSQADLEAAAAMDPEAQTEMARGMVARLSDRLAAQGGTAEEWARLLRGLGVLGETDRAAAIWAEAQTNFAGQPGLETIRAAAVAAGVAE